MPSRIRIALLLAMSVIGAVAVADEDLLLPADQQVPILMKVWSLDRTFTRERPVRIAVLYQEKFRQSERAKQTLSEAVTTLKAPIRIIPVALQAQAIGAQIPGDIDVVYVTPLRAVDIHAIASETRARHLRSVTPLASYVTDGLTLGLVVENDRPMILINRKAAEAEGADYSSQLLRLARLVM